MVSEEQVAWVLDKVGDWIEHQEISETEILELLGLDVAQGELAEKMAKIERIRKSMWVLAQGLNDVNDRIERVAKELDEMIPEAAE